MAVRADSVVVELEAKTQAYRQDVNHAATDFERSAARITAAGDRAERAAGSMGAAMSRSSLLTAAAGAGVAAAVVAVTRAIVDQAPEAARYAASIADTAARLHVTTDALQEYRYAVRAAGGEERGADQALLAFSQRLGDARGGIQRAVRAFASIGISRQQIQSLNDTDAALRLVVQRINELGTSAEQDSAIRRMGLEGMAPLINQGADAMVRLRDEAHRMGVVMDAELVRRGGELNDQFETLERVIAVQLHSALVDLGPVLVGLLQLVAQFARAIGDIVDQLRAVERQTSRGIQMRQVELAGQIAADRRALASGQPVFDRDTALASAAMLGGNGPLAPPTLDRRAIEARIAQNTAEFARNAQLLNERAAAATPSAPTGDRSLIAPPGRTGSTRTPHGPNVALRDLQAEERTQRAIFDAQQRRLAAELGAVRPLEDQQAIQAEIVQSNRAQRDAAIRAQVEQHRLSQGASGLTQAQADRINAENALADAAEDSLRHYRDRIALSEQDVAIQEELTRGATAILDAQGALAQTTVDRVAIAQRILQLEHDQELRALEARRLSDQRLQGPAGDRLYQQLRSDIDQRFGVQMQGTIRPILDEWRDGVRGAFEALREGGAVGVLEYLADRFKRRLLDNLADAVTNLLAQAAGLGGGGGGGGNFIAAGLNFLFGGHRASGGPVRAGVTYEVGERGRELFTPVVDGFITPNGAMAGGTVHNHFHLEGAVVTQDLLNQMNAIGNRAAIQGAQGGLALVERKQLNRAKRRLG